MISETDNQNNGYIYFMGAATGTGLYNAITVGAINGSNASNELEFITASPTANQVLFGPNLTGSYESSFTTYATLYGFSSTTGESTGSSPFFEGNAAYGFNGRGGLYCFNTTYAGTTSANGAFSANCYEKGVTTQMIRDWGTGAILGSLTNSSCVPSPDGKYYAYPNESSNLGFYSVATQNNLTLYTSPENVYQLNWAAGDRFCISQGGNSMVVGDFNGSTASTLSSTIPVGTDGQISAFSNGGIFSPDGTKVATPDSNGTGVQIYNAETGAKLWDIAADTNDSAGIRDVSFSATNNLMCLAEVAISGNAASDEYRVYNIAGTSPVLVNRNLVALPAAFSDDGTDSVISPDGSVVVTGFRNASTSSNPLVTGSVRIYKASTGTLISEYDNQAVPDLYNPSYYTYGPIYFQSFTFSPNSKLVLWGSDGVLITIPTAPIQLGLTLAPSSVVGGKTSTATITLTPAPSSATTVTLAASSSSATVPSSVSVSANATTATFSVQTSGVASATSATITATLGSASASAALDLTTAALSSVSFSPSTVSGGTSSTGTVTLTGNAPPAGFTVTLTSANPAIVKVPASVAVGANKGSATFSATTAQPIASTAVKVTATAGSVTLSATLTVNRTASVLASFDVSSVTGGQAILATISLLSPAPTGGATVTLASSNAALTPRASITIPAGQSSVTFGVATVPVVGVTSATLTATLPTKQAATAAVSVEPPVVLSVTPAAARTIGGTPTFAVVILNGPAPTGLSYSCSSNNADLVVPASLAVTKGQLSAVLNMTTKTVTSSTPVKVTVGSQSCTITLLPVGPASALPPSVIAWIGSPTQVVGGSTVAITLLLDHASVAPVSFNAASSSQALPLPAAISFEKDQMVKTFTLTVPRVSGEESVTLTIGGVTHTIRVLP